MNNNNMLLIGHTEQYDIYQALNGEIWHYFGNNKEDFKDAKMWKRITDTIKADKEYFHIEV
jgi:hypothetical protein